MTSATSLIFIIAGAVMAFVVSYNADAIYIQSLGAAVMAIGGLGLAASILLKPTRLQAQAHPGSQADTSQTNGTLGPGGTS